MRRYKIENCTGLFEVGLASAGRLVNRIMRLLREVVTSEKGSSDSRFRSTLHPHPKGAQPINNTFITVKTHEMETVV